VDLTRYQRRFGGEGTIVSLADGRAFTAAHCVAAADGGAGTVLVAWGGRQWRVVRRWSPRGRDLAWLEVVEPRRTTSGARRRPPLTIAAPDVLRPGLEVVFHAHTGRRFVRRRAVVVSVSATRAVAEVRSPAGVADGDSGGPVLAGGRLAGIVIARLGAPRSSHASSHLVLTRLDLHGFCTNSPRPAF
jgi:Trypsin-like peptidase domain